jgi:hypothetical protein
MGMIDLPRLKPEAAFLSPLEEQCLKAMAMAFTIGEVFADPWNTVPVIRVSLKDCE